MGEPRIKDNISWNRDALRTSFELFECPDMSAQALKRKRTDGRLLRMSSSVRGGGQREPDCDAPAHIELYEVLQGLRDLDKRLWPVGRGSSRGCAVAGLKASAGWARKPHGADQASMAECWRRYSRR